MTHLPFIVAAYAVTVSTVLTYAIASALRLRKARRVLAAAEAARSRGVRTG